MEVRITSLSARTLENFRKSAALFDLKGFSVSSGRPSVHNVRLLHWRRKKPIGVRLIGGSMDAGSEVTASSRFQQFGAIFDGTVETIDFK
ncbi:hypothetical protein N2603_37950 [Bradyrhizobium huanghuaihaiense]|uniref:hypothetical protein n=1 Tax=Bradyrhizobium huanghuaihaiense TaxID=990078 RepID=UPI0021AA83F6|nr:hypothetical protein [Bradyrhizobium sp. CB3035]UWU75719.1 hypothetical protein N2603_37950 [Bradyrhizobium sp. CB3035]